jgi:hypothetical protein
MIFIFRSIFFMQLFQYVYLVRLYWC